VLQCNRTEHGELPVHGRELRFCSVRRMSSWRVLRPQDRLPCLAQEDVHTTKAHAHVTATPNRRKVNRPMRRQEGTAAIIMEEKNSRSLSTRLVHLRMANWPETCSVIYNKEETSELSMRLHVQGNIQTQSHTFLCMYVCINGNSDIYITVTAAAISRRDILEY
jgi:hypothetical protein